jgi:hypothetical protein
MAVVVRASRAAPTGTLASRALGDTNNAGARRCPTQSTSSCQASGAIRLRPQRAGDRPVRRRAGERARGDARSTASRRVSDATGSGSADESWSSAATRSDSCTTHVTVRAGFADHAEAGIRGDCRRRRSEGRGLRPRRPGGLVGGDVTPVPLDRQCAIAAQDRCGGGVHLQRRQRTEPVSVPPPDNRRSRGDERVLVDRDRRERQPSRSRSSRRAGHPAQC